MAQKKYRVHEVGKDFNVKSTDVLELLKKYFDDDKNNHLKHILNVKGLVLYRSISQHMYLRLPLRIKKPANQRKKIRTRKDFLRVQIKKLNLKQNLSKLALTLRL